MKIRTILPTFALLTALMFGINGQEKSPVPKPLKALLVAGGCCHDYKGQHVALYKGIQALANVQVDVVWTDDKSVDPPLPLFDDPNWAKGYDVIIHDECAAGNKDLKVMKHILDAHKTIPAVHLHCAMHSFRNGTDQWFKHLGLQSTRHGPQEPIKVEFVENHPITKTLENWTTIKEELYNNVDVFDANPLALGKQLVKRKGEAEAKEEVAIVAWTNETQGAPTFSTSLGHNTATVEDPRYLELVTRGLLWTCGKLNDDYLGTAFTGENRITFVPAKPKPKPKQPTLGSAPKDATIAIMTASSEETGKNNFAWRAVDGDKKTRWCASGGGKPQWLQLELDKAHDLSGIEIVWESGNNAYQRKIETSSDGKSWTLAVDETSSTKNGDTRDSFSAAKARFVRITCTGTSAGGWASIREVKLLSPTIKSLFPKLDKKQAAKIKAQSEYAKEGNIPPKIVKLSAEEEAAILKQVKVPEEFDVSVFSSWQAANYPVYVAASPSGDLYVASDGNGSLGREPKRGRVLRLRDTDQDGRADEVTEFIKNIDSPRGLVWDHDRLYVLHPPHISVHFDKNHDGIAEDSKMLIEGIAFGFKDRPADHTTNGLDIGIDGWLYIAGGDFGFMKAKGTDGTELQHRGGGVIRFRPDGSGLEIFATGTRNILGTPISPLLDIFARDNTNDGGGWNVRFHHFSGLEDHGYPRMYKNFPEEHVQPLADYGGGSGCGSVYLSEPGFPEKWNNAPMTCDWGTGALWKHTVERVGAGFKESTKPEKFIALPRPTDADVDGMSAIYQASWKGPATFKWAGAETGFIVKVTPKGYTPDPLPDFEKMADRDLIDLMINTQSQVRRIAAQRALLRRKETPEMINALLETVKDPDHALPGRIAALYAVSQRAILCEPGDVKVKRILVNKLDQPIRPFVYRALGDLGLYQTAKGKPGAVAGGILNYGIADEKEDPRTILEAIVATARQNRIESASTLSLLLGHGDARIAHTVVQALAKLRAFDPCFTILQGDDVPSAARRDAAFALMRMHLPEVVDRSINALQVEERPEVRNQIISILCRLYHREAEWKGNSWGTRPDTRGPYYELASWDQSRKILTALKANLAIAATDEAAFQVREMNRNRIQSDEAQKKIITMAKDDKSLIPAAVAQIASSGSVTADSIPLLIKAASDPGSSATTLSQSIAALAKTDHSDALAAMLSGLASLDKAKGAGKEQSAGRDSFLKAPKLENHHAALEKLAAENFGTATNTWANAGLLALASRKKGSPESREMTQKAIDTAWSNPQHKTVLLNTVSSKYKTHFLDDKILVALHDPDEKVAKAAAKAARSLKLQLPGDDKTPLIATLKPEDAVRQVVKSKGDVALGESVFARANCAACHTTNQDEQQKGPYLGNIAQTYNREQLTEAVLVPNKTIAQGFKTNVVTLKDGTMQMGFVTAEAGDKVTLRDIAANEHTISKDKIQKRDTLPTSMMPPGLVNGFSVKEVASLVDYLVKLSK